MTALPKYKFIEIETTRHGKSVVYFRRGRGVRVRLPRDMSSDEFRRHYFAALGGKPIPYLLPKPPLKAKVQKQRTERALRKALSSAELRSKKRGCAFSLTLDWALETVERQKFCCALTGLPFYMDNEAASKVNPFAPSCDRIDTKGGYTPDNVRVVIFAINAMMLDWGIEIFEIVAGAYREQKRRTKQDLYSRTLL